MNIQPPVVTHEKYLHDLFSSQSDTLFDILYRAGVLPNDIKCCNNAPMKANLNRGIWICRNYRCSSEPKSLHSGNFFTINNHLIFSVIIRSIYYWLENIPFYYSIQANQDKLICICDEILFDQLYQIQNRQQIGGTGRTVFLTYINYGTRNWLKGKFHYAGCVVAGYDILSGEYFIECIISSHVIQIFQSLVSNILPNTEILTDCTAIMKETAYQSYTDCRFEFAASGQYLGTRYEQQKITSEKICEIRQITKFEVFMSLVGSFKWD